MCLNGSYFTLKYVIVRNNHQSSKCCVITRSSMATLIGWMMAPQESAQSQTLNQHLLLNNNTFFRSATAARLFSRYCNKVLYPKKSHCIKHKLAEAIIKQTPL